MIFNCYIDESGDEGIDTGGTRWFILGAIIVPEEIDLKTSTMSPRIKQILRKEPQHALRWSQIRPHDKRLYMCSELLTEDWVFSCIVTDKTHSFVMGAPGLREKWNLYFYSTRLLLERLSWYARDHSHQKAKLIFEKRDNMSYDALRTYLNKLYDWTPPPPLEISWAHLDWENFQIIPKGKNRMLQAADLVCGALSDGLEYSQLGNIEPRYIISLIDRFYRRQGKLFSYGFKFLHIRGNPLTYHQDEYPWLKTI